MRAGDRVAQVQGMAGAEKAEKTERKGREEGDKGGMLRVTYLLMLARDLEILTLAEWEKLDDLRRRAGGLTWRLARSLEPGPS